MNIEITEAYKTEVLLHYLNGCMPVLVRSLIKLNNKIARVCKTAVILHYSHGCISALAHPSHRSCIFLPGHHPWTQLGQGHHQRSCHSCQYTVCLQYMEYYSFICNFLYLIYPALLLTNFYVVISQEERVEGSSDKVITVHTCCSKFCIVNWQVTTSK